MGVLQGKQQKAAGAVSGNSHSLVLFLAHQENLLQGGFLLTRLIKYLIENFASEEKAREVEEFFKINIIPGCDRTVSQAVETIRLNAAWLDRDLEKLSKYLKGE